MYADINTRILVCERKQTLKLVSASIGFSFVCFADECIKNRNTGEAPSYKGNNSNFAFTHFFAVISLQIGSLREEFG